MVGNLQGNIRYLVAQVETISSGLDLSRTASQRRVNSEIAAGRGCKKDCVNAG